MARLYPRAYHGDTEGALAEILSGTLQRSRAWRKEAGKARLVERFAAGGAILDVGCGDGRFLVALDAARWRRGGVDFSAETVSAVRARLPDLDLVTGDVFSGALEPESYDVLTFWHVLEHLPDTRAVLARARALLRPGGWLFVSVPNLDSLQARLFRRHWYAFDDVPRHLFHFSPRALGLLLEETHFALAARLPFCPIVNFHCLKHSLVHWSEDRFGSRAPYYAMKPLLFAFLLLERLTGKPGMLTLVARRLE